MLGEINTVALALLIVGPLWLGTFGWRAALTISASEANTTPGTAMPSAGGISHLASSTRLNYMPLIVVCAASIV
jgi:hypothetical protein